VSSVQTQAVTVLFSVVSGAIFFKLLGAWSSYRVAAVRQDLFEIRDTLFDVALEHPFLFNHPAYTRLRFKINISIRLAHKFTMTRLLVAMWVRQFATPPKDDWPETLSTLPIEIQDRLMSIQKAMLFRMACHVLHLPLHLGWRLLDVVKAFSLEGASKAKQEIRDKVEILEVQAAEESEMEMRIVRSTLVPAGR
jgi:hypothetical protein